MYLECEKGWHPLIWKYCEKITRIEPNVVFMQIKEKFAGLRIYCAGSEDAENMDIVHDLCELAEQESYRTCERCGFYDPGFGAVRTEVRNLDGWSKTLCTNCYGDIRCS